MKYKPYKYQAYATQFILEHDACGLFLDMGFGKTVITLTACEALLHDYFSVSKVLVIAPLLPAKETWPEELKKWDHLQGLSYSLIVGSLNDRMAAIAADADIYIVNRENVTWLVKTLGRHWPFDMVVVDELSSFKSSRSQRFKALRKVRKYISRFVGLTGTPAPNGLLDLWSQIFLMDEGKRLGRTMTSYRQEFFIPGRRGPQGIVYDWRLQAGAEERIFEKLSDICVSMKTEDYIELPDKFFIRQNLGLDPAELKMYKQLERDMLLPFKDGDVDAGTAAILANKLLQAASGAVYDENGKAQLIHNKKLDALDQLLEEANGQSVLVFYNYKHELDRIKEKFPEAVHIKDEDSVHNWNSGKIKLLLANPASAGHGLNLQFGGHIIVWFSPTWNLEFYEQANKRLHRRGQKDAVKIYNLISTGTIDSRVLDVVLANKKACQDGLMQAVQAMIKEVNSND